MSGTSKMVDGGLRGEGVKVKDEGVGLKLRRGGWVVKRRVQ